MSSPWMDSQRKKPKRQNKHTDRAQHFSVAMSIEN